jgi:thymidylate kinase
MPKKAVILAAFLGFDGPWSPAKLQAFFSTRRSKMSIEDFERRSHELLVKYDPNGDRRARWPRPFMIELFGTPKSGKTTNAEMLGHFLKRNKWLVLAPTEGAEVVTWPRVEPVYNFATCEYAMGIAREVSFSKNYHGVIFDRAIMDGVVRMDYYVAKGVITEEQRRIIEGYYLLPWNTDLFDMHICLTATPEVAIQRELARALTKRDGETMNIKTLTGLLEAHERVLTRLSPTGRYKFVVHDSSKETPEQTASSLLDEVLLAFEARLAAL